MLRPAYLLILLLTLGWRAVHAVPLTVLATGERALYNIDTDALGSPVYVGPISPGTDLAELVAASGDTLYTFDRATSRLITLRRDDASVIDTKVITFRLPIHQTRGFDLSPDGVLFGIVRMQLYSIDPVFSFIANVTGAVGVEAIAFSDDGTLYAAGSATDISLSTSLYVLDPTTAVLSFIADMPVPDIDSLTFANDGFLYGADSERDEVADLYQINPHTAAVRNLGSTGVVEVNGIVGQFDRTVTVTVAEPSSTALLAVSLAGYVALFRRRHRARLGGTTARA